MGADDDVEDNTDDYSEVFKTSWLWLLTSLHHHYHQSNFLASSSLPLSQFGLASNFQKSSSKNYIYMDSINANIKSPLIYYFDPQQLYNFIIHYDTNNQRQKLHAIVVALIYASLAYTRKPIHAINHNNENNLAPFKESKTLDSSIDKEDLNKEDHSSSLCFCLFPLPSSYYISFPSRIIFTSCRIKFSSETNIPECDDDDDDDDEMSICPFLSLLKDLICVTSFPHQSFQKHHSNQIENVVINVIHLLSVRLTTVMNPTIRSKFITKLLPWLLLTFKRKEKSSIAYILLTTLLQLPSSTFISQQDQTTLISDFCQLFLPQKTTHPYNASELLPDTNNNMNTSLFVQWLTESYFTDDDDNNTTILDECADVSSTSSFNKLITITDKGNNNQQQQKHYHIKTATDLIISTSSLFCMNVGFFSNNDVLTAAILRILFIGFLFYRILSWVRVDGVVPEQLLLLNNALEQEKQDVCLYDQEQSHNILTDTVLTHYPIGLTPEAVTARQASISVLIFLWNYHNPKSKNIYSLRDIAYLLLGRDLIINLIDIGRVSDIQHIIKDLSFPISKHLDVLFDLAYQEEEEEEETENQEITTAIQQNSNEKEKASHEKKEKQILIKWIRHSQWNNNLKKKKNHTDSIEKSLGINFISTSSQQQQQQTSSTILNYTKILQPLNPTLTTLLDIKGFIDGDTMKTIKPISLIRLLSQSSIELIHCFELDDIMLKTLNFLLFQVNKHTVHQHFQWMLSPRNISTQSFFLQAPAIVALTVRLYKFLDQDTTNNNQDYGLNLILFLQHLFTAMYFVPNPPAGTLQSRIQRSLLLDWCFNNYKVPVIFAFDIKKQEQQRNHHDNTHSMETIIKEKYTDTQPSSTLPKPNIIHTVETMNLETGGEDPLMYTSSSFTLPTDQPVLIQKAIQETQSKSEETLFDIIQNDEFKGNTQEMHDEANQKPLLLESSSNKNIEEEEEEANTSILHHDDEDEQPPHFYEYPRWIIYNIVTRICLPPEWIQSQHLINKKTFYTPQLFGDFLWHLIHISYPQSQQNEMVSSFLSSSLQKGGIHDKRLHPLLISLLSFYSMFLSEWTKTLGQGFLAATTLSFFEYSIWQLKKVAKLPEIPNEYLSHQEEGEIFLSKSVSPTVGSYYTSLCEHTLVGCLLILCGIEPQQLVLLNKTKKYNKKSSVLRPLTLQDRRNLKYPSMQQTILEDMLTIKYPPFLEEELPISTQLFQILSEAFLLLFVELPQIYPLDRLLLALQRQTLLK